MYVHIYKHTDIQFFNLMFINYMQFWTRVDADNEEWMRDIFKETVITGKRVRKPSKKVY